MDSSHGFGSRIRQVPHIPRGNDSGMRWASRKEILMNLISCSPVKRFLGTLAIVVCLAMACESGVPPEHRPRRMPDNMPDDFCVRSNFFGATVTPKYHCDYYIVLDAAVTDTISFHPDYESSSPPVWTETFDSPRDSLESVYALMLENDIFRSSWEPMPNPPIGGSTRSLEVVGDNRSFYIPPQVNDASAVEPVFVKIDSLVPGEVWDTLWSRRDCYIEDHP
jgi:hypothetical protein